MSANILRRFEIGAKVLAVAALIGSVAAGGTAVGVEEKNQSAIPVHEDSMTNDPSARIIMGNDASPNNMSFVNPIDQHAERLTWGGVDAENLMLNASEGALALAFVSGVAGLGLEMARRERVSQE